MTGSPLEISVIVCAYTMNRWDELVTVVASLKKQTPLHEIIVVIDHNPVLYERASKVFDGIVLLENKYNRGLSGARNTGIENTQGDIIAFIDEDAVPASDWLTRIAAHYADPDVLGVGGAIIPNWIEKRPGWFPDEFLWVVGCAYRGLPQQVQQIRNLIGCNMSYRRETFDQIGGFRKGIGRIGTLPVGCEETEWCIRLHQDYQPKGGVLIYDPEISVYHNVPAIRSNWSYFVRRCFAEGISKALISQYVGTSDGLASERKYTFRVLPSGVIQGIKDAVRGNWSALGRSAAIVIGLTLTVMGFVFGSIQLTWAKIVKRGLSHEYEMAH